MKPINLNTAPCVPMSSNCVIWQGDNIPCINLCHGDTVSDVVFKLATELCTIMDQLNVSNYDLTCFGINACGPNDFQALIQFLITQICELQGVTPSTKENTTGCPDCLVTVAPCFVVGTNPPITTMNLTDYVNMIAARVCEIIDELVIINATLIDLDNRVTVLENAIPPSFVIPSYITECQIGLLAPGKWDIDIILEAFTNDVWCPFYDATGSTSEILAAVASECISGGDPSRANPLVDMNVAYPTWVNTSLTLADTINNIWIALCDLYNSALTVADTTTVNLTYTSGVLTAALQDTGWKCLLGFDFYSSDPTMVVKKPQVRRIGNVLHFRGTLTIPLDSGRTPGTVVDWLYKAGTDTYQGVSTLSDPANSATPYQGPGGMSFLSGGSLQFNKGASVIPLDVLPTGYVLDGGYATGWRMGWRSMDTGSCSTVLTTMATISIGINGALSWGALADLEESWITGCKGAWSTAHMNYVISHVIAGQHVSDFKTSLNIYDSTLTGNQPTVSFTDPNSPAGTPFSYTKASGLDFKVSELYPITINANNQTDLGGFSITLDGLTAFIGPCVTTIPTPTLDAAACAGTC